eukprot:GHVU01058658.1.p1 GENE.GHVU01058658.1~~GHVU01058658.1.p1  ORF type:complete len:157 (-),score=3.32 GHVU01058658.1:1759-2229(-)
MPLRHRAGTLPDRFALGLKISVGYAGKYYICMYTWLVVSKVSGDSLTDAHVHVSLRFLVMPNFSDTKLIPVIIYDARHSLNDNQKVPVSAIEVQKTKKGKTILESLRQSKSLLENVAVLVHHVNSTGQESFEKLGTHTWESEPEIVSVIVANQNGA